MDNAKILKAINSMEVTDYSASGEEMEYILVEDNIENRTVLYGLGMTNEEIESECYPEDGELDLITVGFKYADTWFVGKGFQNE